MKDIFSKELPKVAFDLTGEVRPVVVHREQDPLELKWLLEGLSDSLDSVHELGDALEGEELTLDGDEDGI
jgi:hypothetical protein